MTGSNPINSPAIAPDAGINVSPIGEEIDKREALAEASHEIWSHWMKWQFSLCEFHPDGSATIPPAKVQRWMRQMTTAYADLSEDEKESDRHQADKILEVFKQ